MRQPSEEEIQALEAEMAKLSVDDVLLQTIVTLINLGARKAGLAEGTEADWPQVRKAVDGARALLPIVEAEHGDALAPVRDALSRLQMAYVQGSGGQAQAEGPQEPPPDEGSQESQQAPGDPGPAQKSGRLWVPGQ